MCWRAGRRSTTACRRPLCPAPLTRSWVQRLAQSARLHQWITGPAHRPAPARRMLAAEVGWPLHRAPRSPAAPLADASWRSATPRCRCRRVTWTVWHPRGCAHPAAAAAAPALPLAAHPYQQPQQQQVTPLTPRGSTTPSSSWGRGRARQQQQQQQLPTSPAHVTGSTTW